THHSWHASAQGQCEAAGTLHVAAAPDNLQPARTVDALRDKPIDAARQNLRDVDERFHVVDHRRLLPQTDLAREWRLVARFGAMAFDGLEKRALFPADVATRSEEHTSELQSPDHLVCRLLLEKKKQELLF